MNMADTAQVVPSISAVPAPEPEPDLEQPPPPLPDISVSSIQQQTEPESKSSQPQHHAAPPEPSSPAEWGRNFWVTLTDPQSGTQFYACPSTGETTWDAPVGHFVLPPSSDGEWWELHDETRGGISYYYHTRTGETTWDKPDGFVIPLGVVQNTTLGRRLSQSARRHSQLFSQSHPEQPQPHSSTSTSSHTHTPSSYKTRRTTRHGHSLGHSHGPPSVISERTEEVTEDAGGFSSEREKDPDRHRAPNDSELIPGGRARTPHATPSRSPSSASTSSHHQHKHQHHHLPPPSPSASTGSRQHSPSRLRTKSHSNSSLGHHTSSGSGSGSTGSKTGQQSLTAVAEYIVNGRANAGNGGRRTPPSNSRKSNMDNSFSPTASSSPVRRPASASATVAKSTSDSNSTATPPLPSTSGTIPSTSSAIAAPEFSKLRKISSGNGVGVGVGTSMVLKHAAAAAAVSGGHNEEGLSDSTGPLPRPKLHPHQPQYRSFSASTPPSSVISSNTANGGVKGKPTMIRDRRNTGVGVGMGGIVISPPVLDIEKTLAMSPMRLGDAGAPIHVQLHSPMTPTYTSSPEPNSNSSPGSPTATPFTFTNGHHPHPAVSTKRLSTGPHPLLPRELVSDIQQFGQSEFARKYFATHKEGVLFRRRVPLERMMSWQKAPLTQPLLLTSKLLHKDATKAFKSIQRIMGDRDRDRSSSNSSTLTADNSSSSSLHPQHLYQHPNSSTAALLEEERTLLADGLATGEMRDEIYCQVVKQLSHNPSPESIFRGWQLLCVLLVTFPPSKDFEPYVRCFIESHARVYENGNGNIAAASGPNSGQGNLSTRIDLMARHCLTRLETVSKRGPRGKPPSLLEIEIASDAAFNPSTFGEPLSRIFKIQQRTYPALKVPIILPFLTDGILALGGTKAEGIFRVSGDPELVNELKLRIDRGVYTLDGIDDPHVLASLLKLWLRELREPLFPSEMYNSCVACSADPERCVEVVRASPSAPSSSSPSSSPLTPSSPPSSFFLPTLNRRVILFVISFLQLFLDDRIYRSTKMSAEALSLVIAPNLMRCASDVVGVVVNNARYEQQFICNLLLHLRCDQIDPDYIPEHGRGALSSKKSSNHGHGHGNGHGHSKMQHSESSSGSGAGTGGKKASRRKDG